MMPMKGDPDMYYERWNKDGENAGAVIVFHRHFDRRSYLEGN